MSKPNQNILVMAIDGPSGTGKGTIASRVASHLGWHTLDSGALYRAFAHVAAENDISPNDALGLKELIRTIDIAFIQTNAGLKISADGKDVTDCVRSEIGGKRASIFAKNPLVRQGLLERQRRMRIAPGLVADGRDMGTVVFPDAFLKIFLDASASIRAQRRYNQLKEKGFSGTLRALEKEIAERDAQDRNRSASPLIPASDAIVLDTSGKGIVEVLNEVVALIEERLLEERFSAD